MPKAGIALGDIICRLGLRAPGPCALRSPAARSRGFLGDGPAPPRSGHSGHPRGASLWNGNLYCPATPKALFDLGPLGRRASEAEVGAHDERIAELARYKLGRISAPDAEGFCRVACPAVMGKVRCPLREASMALGLSRPEVASVPEHPPSCCTQQTITVPPSVNQKTAQKSRLPLAPWRRSYARRSRRRAHQCQDQGPGHDRRRPGVVPGDGTRAHEPLLACALVVRNLAVADAFDARAAVDQRRAAAGLGPKIRRRRRTTISDLVGASAPP